MPPDAVIRKFRSTAHDWSTRGHDRATCTECKEPAEVSVDWLGSSTWAASYCSAHLLRAIANRKRQLGRDVVIEDQRIHADPTSEEAP